MTIALKKFRATNEESPSAGMQTKKPTAAGSKTSGGRIVTFELTALDQIEVVNPVGSQLMDKTVFEVAVLNDKSAWHLKAIA